MGTPEEAPVREAIESDVKARCEAGDIAGAATAAIRGFGPEIYGLLCAMHRDVEDAGDVFSAFSEDLWQGLAAFEWRSTLRTWAYTLARHASSRFLRGQRRRRDQSPLSEGSVAEKVAHQVRSATQTWMRTETKDRFALIRDALPPEDRLLLVLRVDRRLEWTELARVFAEGEAPDDEAVKREAARLRKRFQLLKGKLVEAGRREGLLPRGED